MRPLLAFIFLLTVVMAKDNFIYEEDKPDCNERLTKVEERLTQAETEMESFIPLRELSEANRAGVEKNAKKIYEITVMNKSNGKKISDIASSLNAIKDILSDSTKMMAHDSKEVVITSPYPDVQATDMSGYIKKEAFTRISVQVDNLMDRVSVLEKGMMERGSRPQAERGEHSIMDGAKSALYGYFEYYVIATVVLFFMMFIIIFSLVGKTRHLHLAIEELADRN